MNSEKETFFDKNTLIAVLLLGLCWIGWDSYMRKKYPSRSHGPPAPPAEKPQSSPLTEAEGAASLRLFRPSPPPPPESPERVQTFAGEKISGILSSRGMGFKEIRLKTFFDQKKQPVVFKDGGGSSLFALSLAETNSPIPFQLERRGESFIGRYDSKELRLTKTIRPDEENFAFDVRVEISRFPPDFSGFRVSLRHALPETLPEPWYSKLLFIAGRDISGAFVFSREGAERFLAEELSQEKAYPTLSLLGLGGKYFGLALVNQSDLLPSGVLKKSAKSLTAALDYKPLTKAPFSLSWRIFCGPKSVERLAKSDGRLAGWINFGFFEWLARPLLKILKVFFKTAGNWGLAIVLLTFLVRLLLLPLNIRSYKSMKVMQKLQPQLQEMREKYKKDPQKLNQEMMALMKTHKANPLGGCLPLMLIQFPVFIALYRVLGESIELYQAPFVFWIKDLSLHDPFYTLPVLGGLVLFFQQKLTPMNVPPAQARLLTAMPLVFSVFMLKLPSGLTLYIFVSGLFGLAQQFFFVRSGSASKKEPPAPPPQKK